MSCRITLRRLHKLRKKKIDLKPLWLEKKLALRLAKANTYRILLHRYRKELSKDKRTQRLYTKMFSLFPLLLSLLPEKAKRDIFEPAVFDLIADTVPILKQCKTKREWRRQIRRMFFGVTIIIGDCYRVVCIEFVRRRLRGGLKSLLGM
jgi:hypothetical protein